MRLVRDAFGERLLQLGRQRPEIVVLTADLSVPTRVAAFAKELPERCFQVGIAEQNMMGIAAGLATTGKIVFAATFACFASRRAADQVAISVAYPRLNVKIVSTLTGIYASKNGATHQGMEDIAVMRALPNMMVVVPADFTEVGLLLERIVEYEGPVYFRVASIASPDVFQNGYEPTLGKAVVLRQGSDVTLVGTGIMTARALEAALALSAEGIEATVLHVHTVKPIDIEAIVSCAERTGAVVTAENHHVIGGLGSAVAEVLSEHCPVPVRRVGIPDVFGESGTDDDLTEKYGLSSRHIAETARQIVERRRREIMRIR